MKKYTKEYLDKRVVEIMAERIPPINLLQLYGSLGVDNKTFDRYYPVGSEDRENILTLIASKKTNLARQKFEQLFDNEDTTAQLACAKILDEDMRKALNQRNTDITSGGEAIALSPEAEANVKEALGIITKKE